MLGFLLSSVTDRHMDVTDRHHWQTLQYYCASESRNIAESLCGIADGSKKEVYKIWFIFKELYLLHMHIINLQWIYSKFTLKMTNRQEMYSWKEFSCQLILVTNHSQNNKFHQLWAPYRCAKPFFSFSTKLLEGGFKFSLSWDIFSRIHQRF